MADRCRVPQAFWRAIEQLGLRPTTILRQARLPVTFHLSAQRLITTAQLFAIWTALEELTGDPGLGIKLVDATDTAGHQPMFLAACYAADYRDGIARIARFKRLAAPEQFRMVEKEGQASIFREWLYATAPEPAVSVDASFAFMVALGRRGTGKHVTPVRIDFARPDPKSDTHHAYFGCPIRFCAPRDMLILNSADLDRPFPGHNLELLEILTPALTQILSDFDPQNTFAEQVKVVLKRSLASGRPDVARVASNLGTSERTMQRRITQEGSTFRTLVMETRQDFGRQLLSDPSIEIGEVACLLGYQDTASFYRAFREWEGVTPNRWRAMNGAGPQKKPVLLR